METTIPFSGFYNSIHDEELDQALKSIFSDSRGDAYDSLVDKAFDKVNWQAVHLEYAKRYTEAFADKFNIDLKFKLMTSPKYYNFETDRIFADISDDEVMRLWAMIDRDKLQSLIHRRFTSCDGFISHYPNDLDRWDENILEWDHNQVGTLLECYINQEKEFDIWEELQVMEYHYEVAWQVVENNIEGAEDLFKIADYLRTREERKYA